MWQGWRSLSAVLVITCVAADDTLLARGYGRSLQQQISQDNIHLPIHQPECPGDLVDQTGGTAYFWDCGANCPGGPYTTGDCSCACVEVWQTPPPTSSALVTTTTTTFSLNPEGPRVTTIATTSTTISILGVGGWETTPRAVVTTTVGGSDDAGDANDDDDAALAVTEIVAIVVGATMCGGLCCWACVAGLTKVSMHLPDEFKPRPHIVKHFERLGSNLSLDSWDSNHMGFKTGTTRTRMKKNQVHPDDPDYALGAVQSTMSHVSTSIIGPQPSTKLDGSESWLPLQLNAVLSGKLGEHRLSGSIGHVHSDASTTAPPTGGIQRTVSAPPTQYLVATSNAYIQPMTPTGVSSMTMQPTLSGASSNHLTPSTMSSPVAASVYSTGLILTPQSPAGTLSVPPVQRYISPAPPSPTSVGRVPSGSSSNSAPRGPLTPHSAMSLRQLADPSAAARSNSPAGYRGKPTAAASAPCAGRPVAKSAAAASVTAPPPAAVMSASPRAGRQLSGAPPRVPSR
mmetsp:Transcript_34688/g.80979  ORF Transcript_34688/g.80979 Transcript_34688/m.80979 type:complete len:513 (+) Transcript_34688:5-1543(+)